MRHELLLAGAELESRRTTELASLREAMGVIPAHAFGQKPIESLHTWLRLHVLGQRVYVLDTLGPFEPEWAKWRLKSLGLLSETEMLGYLRQRLQDKDSLPMRIDVHHAAAMGGVAEALRARIVSLARETNAQMDTEVHLEPITWAGSGESPLFLREGKIRTLHVLPVRRPDGGFHPLATGLVEPGDLEQHLLWRFMFPGNVPLTLRIEYDEPSTELAKQAADTARAVAKRLGIGALVEVTEAPAEPVPEAAFLGLWQNLGTDEIQRIDLQPGGLCLLTMSGRSDPTNPGVVVTCLWLPITREIMIDPKGHTMVGPTRYIFRGYINAEGNLVVEKGALCAQGSFQRSGDSWMVFRKVQ
jgi:hypothetical protein